MKHYILIHEKQLNGQIVYGSNENDRSALKDMVEK